MLVAAKPLGYVDAFLITSISSSFPQTNPIGGQIGTELCYMPCGMPLENTTDLKNIVASEWD